MNILNIILEQNYYFPKAQMEAKKDSEVQVRDHYGMLRFYDTVAQAYKMHGYNCSKISWSDYVIVAGKGKEISHRFWPCSKDNISKEDKKISDKIKTFEAYKTAKSDTILWIDQPMSILLDHVSQLISKGMLIRQAQTEAEALAIVSVLTDEQFKKLEKL
jgi:hypothetical protein